MEKVLIILRSVPGAGKSSFAHLIWDDHLVCEADKFWMKDGEYKFDINRLGEAHKWCQDRVRRLMEQNKNNNGLHYNQLVVSNTNTTEKEIKPYLDLAEEFGYKVVSLIVENRVSSENIHGVPEELLQRMETRLRQSIKLR